MTSSAQTKRRLLKNKAVRAHYEALAPEFELARTLIAARARAGLSQEEIAKKMGTSQSAVARLESGKTLPRMATVKRYAEATGSRVSIELVPV